MSATGEDVPLRNKSFRLLCLFLENVRRLLGREAVTEAVWPGVTVSDDSISQCVRDLRRALCDEARTKIRTVPRRGYIFAAEATTERNAGWPIEYSVLDLQAICRRAPLCQHE